MNGEDDDAEFQSIRPDAVSGAPGSDNGIDEMARRAVDVLLSFLRRANALAAGVLIFAVIACVGGYLIGIAALGGGLRTLWIVVGGLAAAWAIGSVVASMFRLRAVRRGSDLLVDEVRSLISGDIDSERTVIETVESTEGADGDGVVQLSRQFFSLRDTVSGHQQDFRALSLALASITTLPAAMALATVLGFGFAFLSVIFGLILIF
ncbi:MAG: hypothetical protein AB8G26_15850 [Ilumatobacter sp.]